jgi:hypothetical protein
MGTIYVRPLAVAVPVVVIAYVSRATLLPGANWLQIFGAAMLTGVLYYALAYLICLDRDHRALLQAWLRQRRTEPRPDGSV